MAVGCDDVFWFSHNLTYVMPFYHDPLLRAVRGYTDHLADKHCQQVYCPSVIVTPVCKHYTKIISIHIPAFLLFFYYNQQTKHFNNFQVHGSVHRYDNFE